MRSQDHRARPKVIPEPTLLYRVRALSGEAVIDQIQKFDASDHSPATECQECVSIRRVQEIMEGIQAKTAQSIAQSLPSSPKPPLHRTHGAGQTHLICKSLTGKNLGIVSPCTLNCNLLSHNNLRTWCVSPGWSTKRVATCVIRRIMKTTIFRREPLGRWTPTDWSH